MPIPVLMQCADEIQRLAVAGSPLAVADYRLKRLVDPLRKFGEKTPVFNRIADAVENLTEGDEKHSPQNLLQLATLVNAVLYTQGETGAEGEFTELETTATGPGTPPVSVRILKPLMEALTTTGSGRYEIIRDAYERGIFKDLRLVRPAIAAIDDSYGEIAEFVTGKVLPSFGKEILPLVRSSLDLKGGRGHARRLSLIHTLDPEAAWDICLEALETGSKDLKVAAIECLGRYPDREEEVLPILVEQRKARSKDVRKAALEELGRRDSDAAVDILLDALKGRDLDLMSASVRSNPSPALLDYLLDEAERLVSLLIRSPDRTDPEKEVPRLVSILSCLEGRTDPKTEAFLISCLDRKDDISRIRAKGVPQTWGNNLLYGIADMLSRLPSSAATEALLQYPGELPADVLSIALRRALKEKDPAWIYEQFSPCLLNQKSGREAKKKAQLVIGALCNFIGFANPRKEPASHRDKLDHRWLDAARKAGAALLVARLVQPGDRKAIRFLREEYDKAGKDYLRTEILRGLFQAQHPEAVRLYRSAIEQTRHQSFSNERHLLHMIQYLPPEVLPELKAYAESGSDKIHTEMYLKIRTAMLRYETE